MPGDPHRPQAQGNRCDRHSFLPFILRGVPGHIRSDNGPEFVAEAVQQWITAIGAKTAYIERGSPWENGYIESFNARLRDELLNGEIFYSLREAQIVIGELETPLQYDQAPRITRLQTTSSRGVRARARRVAGCATSISSADTLAPDQP
jgi:transposase InsO family protein